MRHNLPKTHHSKPIMTAPEIDNGHRTTGLDVSTIAIDSRVQPGTFRVASKSKKNHVQDVSIITWVVGELYHRSPFVSNCSEDIGVMIIGESQ
jgi:hypothetical protein